jgi:hypothetical protein
MSGHLDTFTLANVTGETLMQGPRGVRAGEGRRLPSRRQDGGRAGREVRSPHYGARRPNDRLILNPSHGAAR